MNNLPSRPVIIPKTKRREPLYPGSGGRGFSTLFPRLQQPYPSNIIPWPAEARPRFQIRPLFLREAQYRLHGTGERETRGLELGWIATSVDEWDGRGG